jgi:DNA-binding MarR family transcriptional regulator
MVMNDLPMPPPAEASLATRVSYERQAVRRLARCISEIRELHPEIQAQTIHVLLEVAIQPGITMRQLLKKTSLSQSSCSRNVSLLTDRDRHGNHGLGLVEAKEDPAERRRKIVTLTPKGQELIALLADIVR